MEVADNPGEHPVLIPGTITLTWNIDGSNITISGIPGVSELTGILETDGTFSVGVGDTYAGYLTTYIFNGTITPDGISGMLIIGADGSLPGGQAIWFHIVLLFA